MDLRRTFAPSDDVLSRVARCRSDQCGKHVLGRVKSRGGIGRHGLRTRDPAPVDDNTYSVTSSVFRNHASGHACAAKNQNGAIGPETVTVNLGQS